MPYKDPEKRRARTNERRAQDGGKRNAYERAQYARNPQRRAYLDAWKAANPERVREYGRTQYRRLDPVTRKRANRLSRLRHGHGMQPEDWAVLWQSQGGRCYLCGDDLETVWRTTIDHDHQCCPRNSSCSVCRRGIACFDCNIALGHVRDDPARLRRMADAIEAAQRAVKQRKAAADIQDALFPDIERTA